MGDIVIKRSKKNGRPIATIDSRLIWIVGGLTVAGILFFLFKVIF